MSVFRRIARGLYKINLIQKWKKDEFMVRGIIPITYLICYKNLISYCIDQNTQNEEVRMKLSALKAALKEAIKGYDTLKKAKLNAKKERKKERKLA